MNSQTMMEAILTDILRVVNPLREDVETRMRIIDELRDVVSSIECLKGARVEPFGSFLSQLFSRWGDLDISIELPNGSYILLPAKKHKQKLLGDLLKALQGTGSFRRLQFVSHARVPILKLVSKVQNISCDISINNLSGHMKSKFLLWISLIDRRFRDMVLLVKEWAKANGINNPTSGTFNSYSLSLLVIFHFQTCAPAILPPLKDLYPGNLADELIGVRADMERRVEEIAVSNIARFRKERRVNHSSLSDLFISFLRKFLDISTRTTEQGVCTYSGRWENINTNPRWLPQTHPIIIEDPFEQPGNSARAVARSQLTKISEAFRNTYNLVIDPYQSRNTLIPVLVRREIIHYFPGVIVPRVDVRAMPYQWSTQSARRGYHSSSPFQNHFQKTMQVNHPHNFRGQNGKQPSLGQAHTVRKQLLSERPRSQKIDQQRERQAQPGQQRQRQAQPGQQRERQAQSGHPQVARPPWPNTVQSSHHNNGASQWSQHKEAAGGPAQQVWRQKQLDK